MAKKTLKYDLHKVYGVELSGDNLAELEKDLDSGDAKKINNEIANLLNCIKDVYAQEKYKTDPTNTKVLKAGKLELEVENYQPELEQCEKEALERIGDYNRIDVRDLNLSIRALNCLRSRTIYTLGDLIKAGAKGVAKFRNLGDKTRNELRNLVYRVAPEEYEKYIGEKK